MELFASSGKPPRDDIDQLRRQCRNKIHFSCEVFCSRSSRALLLGLSRTVQPLKVMHSENVVMRKTQ